MLNNLKRPSTFLRTTLVSAFQVFLEVLCFTIYFGLLNVLCHFFLLLAGLMILVVIFGAFFFEEHKSLDPVVFPIGIIILVFGIFLLAGQCLK